MAANSDAVVLAALAILASAVGALIFIIKFMFNKLLPRIENGNEAISKLIIATKTNTQVTRNADDYLRARNGRDDANHEKLVEATQAIPLKMQQIADAQADALLVSLRQVSEQHVEHQHVEQAIVEKKVAS